MKSRFGPRAVARAWHLSKILPVDWRTTFIGFFAIGLLSAPAHAQSPSIGVFLIGDIVRLNQYDARTGDSGNGEAFGFGLRLGTPVGEKWGVELEFARPGEITSDQTPEIVPYLTSPIVRGALQTGPDLAVIDPVTLPAYSFRIRTTQRRTTLSPSLWVRQEISPRFSLLYLGGVAFGRTTNEVEITYLFSRPGIAPIPPSRAETIVYDARPLAGVEGRIRMSGSVDFVPGLRLQSVEGGWLVRPALGLSWTF